MPREPRPDCIECGYSLAGLPEDGVCPECAASIQRSILVAAAKTTWQRARSFNSWWKTMALMFRRPFRAWRSVGLNDAKSGRTLAFVNISAASALGVGVPIIGFGFVGQPLVSSRAEALELFACAAYLALWCWIVSCLAARALVLMLPLHPANAAIARTSRGAAWSIVGHATYFSLLTTPLMAIVMYVPLSSIQSRRHAVYSPLSYWEEAAQFAQVFAPLIWLEPTLFATVAGCFVIRRWRTTNAERSA